MQLGKKSKTTDMLRDLGAQAEDSAPLVSNSQPITTAEKAPSARVSTSADRDAIHATVAESISAKISRDGILKSFNVKGDLQLRISDPSLTKVKLDLVANASHNAQFKTHPNVDKAQFSNSKVIQLKDTSKGFRLTAFRLESYVGARLLQQTPLVFSRLPLLSGPIKARTIHTRSLLNSN